MRKCFCDICEKEVHEIELLNLQYETIDEKKVGCYANTINGFLVATRNTEKKEICEDCSKNLNRIIYGLKPEVSADV